MESTSSEPAMDEKSTAPARISTHPAFDSPDADVVLVSRDLVQFRMHTFTLKTASGWFRSLFSLPKPSPSTADGGSRPAPSPSTTDPETIHLSEDSTTLELLFRMISGLAIQPLISFDVVDALLFAAEKYDMPGPMSMVRIAVMTPPLADQPLRLYAAASRYGWAEEAKVASERTLSMDLWKEDNWEMLNKMDVRSALALLKLHKSRREELQRKLNEDPSVSSCCWQCRRRMDHHAGRELKYRLATEMESGLIEWAEAKACWETKCAHAGCASVQFDKTETIRLIRECIAGLPKKKVKIASTSVFDY